MSIIAIRRYAKKLLAPVIIIIVVALMIGMFYIGFPMMNQENLSYVGPSIKVNGQKLNDAQFNNYLMQASQRASQYAQYGINYTESQIRDMAVTMAVQNMAFEQEIKKAGSKVKVTNGDVDKLIKQYFPTEEELQAAMDKQGVTNKGEFRKIVFDYLQRQKFIAYKAKQLKITVSKADIVASLEQITVSHILVSLKDTSNKPLRSDAEALKRANEAYQKAVNGGNFTQLVTQYSDDPGSKDKGGEYGPMPLDQFKNSMVKEFVDGALALKDGQISKPIKTQYGYHIIKLISRAMPKGEEYKTKYASIRDGLLTQKAQDSPAFTEWLNKITTTAQNNMEILDPGIRAFRLKQQQKWAEASEAYKKALEKKYYKNQLDTYVDASDVYIQLKQPKDAIALLQKAPKISLDTLEYQLALANAYKSNNDETKALDILAKYSQAHANDVSVHQKLKDLYTGWSKTDLAAKEGAIIADIQKREQEKQQQYQEELNRQNALKQNQPNQQPVTAQPTPSPAKK